MKKQIKVPKIPKSNMYLDSCEPAAFYANYEIDKDPYLLGSNDWGVDYDPKQDICFTWFFPNKF